MAVRLYDDVLSDLNKIAIDANDTTIAYKGVLTADENTDITLIDGTKTPSLSKRVKQFATSAVTSVNGKIGDVVIAAQESIESIAEFSNVVPVHGAIVSLDAYYKGTGLGGGLFVYDANIPKSAHNGGSIIDPTYTYTNPIADGYLPDVGFGVWGVDAEAKVTADVKAAITAKGGNLTLGNPLNPTNFRTNRIKLGGYLGSSPNNGNGCWVRVDKRLCFTHFGAIGDGVADDSFAMLATFQAMTVGLNLTPLKYRHGNGDLRNIVLVIHNKHNLVIEGNCAWIESDPDALPCTSQAIIRLEGCSNITINNLFTDGRLDTRMVVGGDPNTNNDQHNFHIGYGCSDIKLNNCVAKRAIMDGIYVYGYTEGATLTRNVELNNCIAEYCYRQGASIITGVNTQVNGGSYSYTGTLSDGKGGTKFTTPAAGIDVEANSTNPLNLSTYNVRGAHFVGNLQKGFVASMNSSGTVDACYFKGNKLMDVQAEYNLTTFNLQNCVFLDGAPIQVWVQNNKPINITNNTFFKGSGIMVNCVNYASATANKKMRIHNNSFINTGVADVRAVSLDTPNIDVTSNYFQNTLPIYCGGDNSQHVIDNNEFVSNLATSTSLVSGWSGTRIASIQGNKVTLPTTNDGILASNLTVANCYQAMHNIVNTVRDPLKIKTGHQVLAFSLQQGNITIPANSTTVVDYTTTGVAPNAPMQVSYNQVFNGYAIAKPKGWNITSVYYVNPTGVALTVPAGFVRIATNYE